VTSAITTTGTCRIDVSAPGVYPAAAINAASKIRVTAATSGDVHDCRACVFTSGATFENNSGQPITVKLLPSQTTPTKLETSGTITFDNAASATLTISGLVTGSDVIIYDASITADGSGSNVLQTSDAVAGTSTTYGYTYGVVTTVDIGVFKNGYKPTFVRGVVLSVSNATIPISQPLDPSYVA